MSIMRFPNRYLLDYDNTVNRIFEQDKGLYMMLAKTIKIWYNDNGVRLESLKDKIKALHVEFLEFEGEKNERKIKIIPEKQITEPDTKEITIIPNKWYQFGKPKEIIKIIPGITTTIPSEPVFIKGKTQEELNERYNALMKIEVEVIF